MPSPSQTPTTTTPTVTDPTVVPWPERYTTPAEIGPQQHRELASPDIAP